MVTDTLQRSELRSPPRGELQTLVVVSGAHLVSHLHLMVLPVLLHLLKERTNVGFFELGLALTTFNVVSGLTQAPMGFLVDRIGARSVLIAGLILGGFAFASMALTDSYAWLIVAALLAGLANCVYHPADYAILNDTVSEGRIGRAFSIHTFAGFAGSAIAPPLLLGLAAAAGLSSSLIAAGAIAWAIAAVVFLIPAAPATRHARATPAAGKQSIRDVLTPTVLGLSLFFTLLALSGSAMSSFSIVALMAGHGISSGAATAALTAYLAAAAAGVLAGGPLADRTARHGNVAAAGFAVSALIALAIAVAPLPVPVLVAAMGATGFLFGVIQPSRDMLVRKAAPPGAAGRVFGIVSTGFNIGGIVGPLLFGWLMDQQAPRAIFGVAVAFMTVTAVLALIEQRRAK
ncbi:MAG TPA: MFS transporter [Hyphomicrobiaceae bacterium]|jgi:MFS family permease|nr:MFS transporter [Hyphomicrobiaceae bacterium]